MIAHTEEPMRAKAVCEVGRRLPRGPRLAPRHKRIGAEVAAASNPMCYTVSHDPIHCTTRAACVCDG